MAKERKAKPKTWITWTKLTKFGRTLPLTRRKE
jgi:hypothetical protein